MSHRLVRGILTSVCTLSLPFVTSGHEVYVLGGQTVDAAVKTVSPNPFLALLTDEKLFIAWGFITVVSFLLVLTASVTPSFERVCDPLLIRLKKYAPLFARFSLGIAIMYCGYAGSFFGPELPMSALLSQFHSHLLSVALVGIGTMLCFGLLTRIMGILSFFVFAFAVANYGTYMFTYGSYLAAIMVTIIFGGGSYSLDSGIQMFKKAEKWFTDSTKQMEPYAYLIMRICFGASIIFASFYAKFLHSNLALETVNEYNLTSYFHFTPLFLVLGAFLIEALIGICIVLGFEVRFSALIFTFFLTLSIIFFGEAVWPHIILFGLNATMFLHGYDEYTAEKRIFSKVRNAEPVL